MRKREKRRNNCCDHDFDLRARNGCASKTAPLNLSFCTQQSKCGKSDCLDCPIYNKDYNYATPTFVLRSERKDYYLRAEKMKEEHDHKMRHYTEEKLELLKPKPRSKNDFCSVCRENYDDYLAHIESTRHKKKLKASVFNNYIIDLHIAFNGTDPIVEESPIKAQQETVVASQRQSIMGPMEQQQQFVCNYNMNIIMPAMHMPTMPMPTMQMPTLQMPTLHMPTMPMPTMPMPTMPMFPYHSPIADFYSVMNYNYFLQSMSHGNVDNTLRNWQENARTQNQAQQMYNPYAFIPPLINPFQSTVPFSGMIFRTDPHKQQDAV